MIERYYFGKYEEIYRRERAMVIMDIRADNFYCFKNFHMNMSYPKKIVDSMIPYEYLEDRPNFRYKKVNILMGANATGKTSLGKMMMSFLNCCDTEKYDLLMEAVDDREKTASLAVDFVVGDNVLYRFHLSIRPDDGTGINTDNIEAEVFSVEIGLRDNYETCAEKLEAGFGRKRQVREIDTEGWSFFYPADACKNKYYYLIEDNPQYISILERIMKTLDPSILKIAKIKEVKNSYAIQMEHRSIIIQDGKILDSEVLSSGTKAGLDISYIIASLIFDKYDLYYCDELFSYVNSDIEKACLSIIIEKLTGRKQLFFTTHNTDILDMQLPKHSFTFLKKEISDLMTPIKCLYASDYLKRNTDCLKNAVENDLFSTAPDLDALYEVADL